MGRCHPEFITSRVSPLAPQEDGMRLSRNRFCRTLSRGSQAPLLDGGTMRKFIIERELPAIGSAERQALQEAAQKSNATLKELGPDIQWVESYVANDKTFCVYLAKDEAIIQEHARRSGFPANKITEIRRMIDPTTATAA